MDECAIFGGMQHLWRKVTFMDECAIFGGMCHFWRNVPFLEECAIFGVICHLWGMWHFWSNVPFLMNVVIFGWMWSFLDDCGHLWMNVVIFGDLSFESEGESLVHFIRGMWNLWMNLTFMDECDIYGWMCHFWRHVTFLEECAIFGGIAAGNSSLKKRLRTPTLVNFTLKV